jgi:DNA-binding transcriptional ArsR family regulator
MKILAEILSSQVRAEFFRILFGIDSNEYHLREIQRRSGLAIGTVRQEAIKLEKLSLIQKRRNGNRTYFRPNKSHPLFNTIHDLVLKTSGLTDLLKESLEIDECKYAFVFGSIASGKENAESDVDLFIIGDVGLRMASKLLKGPCQKIGRVINPHVMTVKEFIQRKNGKEHFISTVLASPIISIKGSEDEFERLGE